ncbi:D-alanine--D-alanine ligase [Bosea sp. Root381]|uniref:D-alanine--D-alanine ligase n=1 Tax=Bosea sp. Root381 TaxID=1736524 RepID=UPI0006FA5AB4|nr:D-alanine--D-alanine ligase [Bosea sp. Root381]KRE00340.1 D-alanine--D-alanine ligase [Bosea sp. Root381]
MTTHVAVLMGGWSVEREVSLDTGAGCAAALESVGFRVTKVDVGRDIAEVLAKLKPDVAFNALHGRFGEDGTIQGLLEILGIPYTHSGVLASSLAIRKDKAKMVVAAAGVPVAHGVLVSRFEAAKKHVLPPPYVLKPVNEGSSVGVVIVKKGREHPPQEIARPDWPCGEAMLAETFIAGRELTCAIMGGKSLGVTEIRASTGEFYDYDAKYTKGGSIHICPAQILPKIYQQIEECALTAHQAIGCRGVSRSDFRYDDETDTLVWLEVNTQPGMTETSLVPELAAHAGLNFGELVKWMVEDASLDR